jgi:hypothetical protein
MFIPCWYRKCTTLELQHAIPVIRWDDWVPSSRLLKLDKEGLARQSQLKEMNRASARKESTVNNNASPGGGSGAGPSKASTTGNVVSGGKGNSVMTGKGKKRTRETAALDSVSLWSLHIKGRVGGADD